MNDLKHQIEALDQRASGSITIVDYTLLGGKTVTVNGTVLTEGAGWTAATSNNATATSLASAINALANINASAASAVITIYADAPGTTGNSYTLATNATSLMLTLSAATLTGGVAATYSSPMSVYIKDGQANVEASISISAFTGASGSAIITPQYSYDKAEWFDDADSIFTAITSGTSLPATETKHMTNTGSFVRFKIVTSGVVSVLTGTIYARAVEGGGGKNESESAHLASMDTALQSIDASLPTIGQKAAAGSVPVVLASDQASSETAGADGASNTSTRLNVGSRMSGFNGTTWDRIRAGVTSLTATLIGWLNTLPYAIYNAAPTSRTEGQGGYLQADVKGNLNTNLGTTLAGEDQPNDVHKVEQQFSYTNITTQTTTVVKNGAGFLHAIIINTPMANGVITIYDNTSAAGQKIGTITLPAALLTTGAVAVPFNVKCPTGITIVTAGANQDITVAFR